MAMFSYGGRSGVLILLGLGVALAAACTSSSSDDAAGGKGGTTGGAAGAGAGGATGGTSGSGGITGGAAGADAGPAPTQCKLACSAPGDCKAFVAGKAYDLGLSCTNGSCLGCTADADCVRPLSNWLIPCESFSDCDVAGIGYACIEADGQGRCAKGAVPDAGGCSPPDGPDVIQMPLWGSSTLTLPVCGHKETAWCHGGQCEIRCIDSNKQPLGNAICLAYVPETSVCNPSTGECECNLDADCENGLKCVNKRCGCKTDGDCSQSLGKQCVQGYCSCGDANDCASIDKKGFDLLAPSCDPVTP
jgi:hypothetical protein